MVYAQNASKEKTSALIGYSLALYMVGISASAFLAGLFKNFTINSFMTICLFTITLAYVQLFVTSTVAGNVDAVTTRPGSPPHLLD